MRIVLEPIAPWYDDLASCLHSTVASLVAQQGCDPVLVLGSGWTFAYTPGEWTPTEYFYPTLGGSLRATLAPHASVELAWNAPPSADAAQQKLIEVLAAGRPAIVAVDNYWLPFRPAYRDVHAGHLLLVYGYDSARREFAVLDAVPPQFDGWLAAETLAQARGSENPAAEDEAFFRGAAIAWRWLDVHVEVPLAELELAWVERVITANLTHLLAAPEGPAWSGVAGLRRYVAYLAEAARDGDTVALKEAYGFGWAPQASAALHASFLHAAALQLDAPALREAARAAELVAHAWTPLRVGAGHAIADPPAAAAYLARRGRVLVDAYDAATARLLELSDPSLSFERAVGARVGEA